MRWFRTRDFPVPVHMLAWMLYGIQYWGTNALTNDITFLEVVISVPFFALITYTIFYIFRYMDTHKRIFIGFMLLFLFYGLFIALAFLVIYEIAPRLGIYMYRTDIPFDIREFLQTLLTLLSNYTWVGAGYFFLRRSIQRGKAREAELEKRLIAEREKRHYEYAALAGQMSNHHMANLVNGWIGQLQPEQGALAKEMERTYQVTVYYMRAQKMGVEERASVMEEVDILKNYIELMRGSGSNKRCMELAVEGRLTGYTLPPTTFLTFFENAIKHGISRDPEHPIRMQVKEVPDGILFTCRNAVADRSYQVSHGIGIQNVTRRLKLAYGKGFTLLYGERDGAFQVELKIKQTF